jgi:hypothetical protein
MYFESYIVIFFFSNAYRFKFICERKDNNFFCKNVFVSAEPALTSFLVTSSERSWGPWTRRLSLPGRSTVFFLPASFSSFGKSAVCSSQVNQLFYSLPGESAFLLPTRQCWAKLLRSLTVNLLSYFVKIKY